MANITVYDFMYLSTEDRNEDFLLWDNRNCEYIHEGDLYDLPEEYEDLIVASWDIAYSNKTKHWVVCLNVNLES